jgi:hypothetical protein
LLEVSTQGESLQRRHAHALAVDRVEATHRIAHGEIAGWETALSFVEVSDAGGEAEADRVVQGLCGADRVIDVEEPEGPREVEEPVGIEGRVVSEDPGQCQHPPIPFESLEGPGPRKVGSRSGQDGQDADEGIGWQPVGPGRIAEPDLHLVALRTGIPESVQPGRRA